LVGKTWGKIRNCQLQEVKARHLSKEGGAVETGKEDWKMEFWVFRVERVHYLIQAQQREVPSKRGL